MYPIKMERKDAATKTLIVVILDESGSMEVQKNDVLGGYKGFIDEQKGIKEDQARMVLIKFNSNVTVSHAAMPIETCPILTAQSYRPGGGTALYDAVAEGIRVGEATEQPDERVLVLIMTDGAENSSKKTSQAKVQKLMKKKEKQGNWTFTYIGENPEGWASSMNQSAGNVLQYNLKHQNANMTANSLSVTAFRRSNLKQSKNFYQ